MHCGAEVTESSTNKQHHLSASTATPTTWIRSSRARLPKRFVIVATPIAATARWLFCRHACLPRGASTVNSCACSFFSPTRRPTTILSPSDISRTSKSSVTVAAGLLPAKPVHHWDVLRLWRNVALPPPRVARDSETSRICLMFLTCLVFTRRSRNAGNSFREPSQARALQG
jgi:hypothetical protein